MTPQPEPPAEPDLEKLTGFFVNTPPATSPMLFPLGPKPLSQPCESQAPIGEQTAETDAAAFYVFWDHNSAHWRVLDQGDFKQGKVVPETVARSLERRLAAQSAELERVKREAKETEEGLQLAFDQRPINGMSVTEAIKALITQLATERQAREKAEAEVELQVADFTKVSEQRDKAQRELAEARNEVEQLRRAIQEADAQFEKVTWGYDGDCGTSRIINKLTTALTTKAPNYIVELKEWKERWADAWAIYRQTQPGTQERVHAFDLLESVYRAARQEESK